MRSKIIYLLVLFSSMTAVVSQAQPPLVKDGNRILQSANEWLALLDAGEFRKSWEEASTPFKQNEQDKDWVMRVRAFRSSLGPVVYRQLRLLEYGGSEETQLTCTLTFQSQYENRAFERETVLMIYEEGDWLLAGYFAK